VHAVGAVAVHTFLGGSASHHRRIPMETPPLMFSLITYDIWHSGMLRLLFGALPVARSLLKYHEESNPVTGTV
jgi:hypothetical protein